MKVNLYRKDLFNLIKGLVPQAGKHTKFTGNQWNEDWDWDIPTFEDMSDEKLFEFYTEQKGK